MQYAGRQGGTLLVKVALRTHADDTQRGTLHLQRLPGKAALMLAADGALEGESVVHHPTSGPCPCVTGSTNAVEYMCVLQSW